MRLLLALLTVGLLSSTAHSSRLFVPSAKSWTLIAQLDCPEQSIKPTVLVSGDDPAGVKEMKSNPFLYPDKTGQNIIKIFDGYLLVNPGSINSTGDEFIRIGATNKYKNERTEKDSDPDCGDYTTVIRKTITLVETDNPKINSVQIEEYRKITTAKKGNYEVTIKRELVNCKR
jgi:hypothetical protein